MRMAGAWAAKTYDDEGEEFVVGPWFAHVSREVVNDLQKVAKKFSYRPNAVE